MSRATIATPTASPNPITSMSRAATPIQRAPLRIADMRPGFAPESPCPVCRQSWRVQLPLEPALPAEEAGENCAERDDAAHDRPPGLRCPEARKTDVHPEDARDQRHREEDHADHRQDAQHVVHLVRDDRLVRLLERVDDLLVVVEHVPDSLRSVDDVVEVELELLGQEALGMALEPAQRGALGLVDLAVRDDLLLDVGDVADDLLGAALEHLVLDRVELVPDLVQDREAVVEEVVEDVVEEVAGALAEQARAKCLVLVAALEEAGDGKQLDGRQRDQEVGAEEDVELGGVQALDGLVVDREVEDDEEVLGVLVDLRPLALREHVLEVERVPAEAKRESLRLVLARRVQVDPGDAVLAELSEPRLWLRDDLAREAAGPDPLDAG